MIAVDWGSSSLRAFRLDASGAVREARRSDHGVLRAEGRFAAILADLIGAWDDGLVVIAGMAGSRQGWMEVPYVRCPANVQGIAAGMRALPRDAFPDRQVWLVPGLSAFDEHLVPDVMRGEESQLCGVLPDLGQGRHYVCLPGTHSKHAWGVDGRIERFGTFMTGELFELLRRHSMLGRMMAEESFDETIFAEGVAMAARDGQLSHQLFGVRSLALLGQLSPAQSPAYLSGLLIGHELQAVPQDCMHVHLVAADHIAGSYLSALRLRGLSATHHGEDVAAFGMHRLARARGLCG